MIVGLCGAIGSGKTTVAKHLVSYCEFTRVTFAGPLKAMLRAGLHFSEEQLNGALKEAPQSLGNKFTPRQAMQWLGEEYGRRLLGENIWVELWQRNAELALKSAPHRVIVDDVRYPNEVKAVKNLGGVIIKIDRPGYFSSGHASEEQQLDWGYSITNDGNIQELTDKIEHALFVVQPWCSREES